MSFPRYPKYKDSGVEWLGQVPEHWDVRRITSLSNKITNGYVGPTRDIFQDYGVRYLQSLHIKGNEIRFDVPYYVSLEWSNQHSKSILETGDVLVVQTGDIGQVAVVTDDFAGCNCHALIIVAPKRSIVDGKWIAWVFNSNYGFQTLHSIQTGALHPHLNCGDVKDIHFPLPSLSEQTAIAAFLDQETAKIDALVAEQQRLIELLKEKRQAVISHAVTKGLNPKASMKPSGIEWLGDVPEHWEFPKIGYHAEVTKLTGFEYTNHWKVETEGEIIALRGFNIGAKELNLEKTERISNGLSDLLSRSKLHKGNIVMPCTGTLGAAAVIDENNKYHINQNIAKVSFNDHFESDYAVYWFTSGIFKSILEHNNMSGMQPVLLIGDIRRIFIPQPPKDEQRIIVEYLDLSCAKLDALTTEAQHAIDLLQERRTALISAAVTGQIDVRKVKNPITGKETAAA